jgi:DNA-binding NarL/FixJ family response regulator
MYILLADDHALFREGLALLLKKLDDVVHIDEVATLDAALARTGNGVDYDLALLDLNMPGMDGYEGVRRMRRSVLGLPLVVISASEDPDAIHQTLAAGALGFIPKSSSSQVMLSALKLILAGGIYAPPATMGRDRVMPARPRPAEPANNGVSLTERQKDVLRLIIEGKPNKWIARELALSEATVKSHLATLYRVLNASNRTEAAMAAQRLGLLDR